MDGNQRSAIVRAAHNLGLATWFGGTIFGQVALNPTIQRISSKEERGQVLNESWARYNALNAVALAATALTWRLGGLKEAADRDPGNGGLSTLKDVSLGGALTTAVTAGLLGAEIARNARGGATPVLSGTTPASETPEQAAWAQRLVGAFGASSIALLGTVISASAVLENRAERSVTEKSSAAAGGGLSGLSKLFSRGSG